MKHYSKAELELYRHGEMSVLGRISCTVHLKECSGCAALLEELREDDRLIRELRSSVRSFQEIVAAFPAKPQTGAGGKAE